MLDFIYVKVMFFLEHLQVEFITLESWKDGSEYTGGMSMHSFSLLPHFLYLLHCHHSHVWVSVFFFVSANLCYPRSISTKTACGSLFHFSVFLILHFYFIKGHHCHNSVYLSNFSPGFALSGK